MNKKTAIYRWKRFKLFN